ncbi:MAG: hypothetical protein EOO27_28105 [Comamonadaceae bacterium]|nr:MAG: hypothetical protein EOO27_28105 [Comamonadaceae bacterium]
MNGDSSVQINTVITDRSAPTRYAYPLDIPSGGDVAAIGGGMFAIFGRDGDIITVVMPPWAQDANGSPLATRYEVEDGALVQYVNHKRPGVAYPVVADPKFAWYGVLPSIKTTRAETYALRTATTPSGLAFCTKLGTKAGIAIGVLCAVNAVSIAINAGRIYAAGKCSQLIIGPGVIGSIAYKDAYCK